jgi:hypothetical protein
MSRIKLAVEAHRNCTLPLGYLVVNASGNDADRPKQLRARASTVGTGH